MKLAARLVLFTLTLMWIIYMTYLRIVWYPEYGNEFPWRSNDPIWIGFPVCAIVIGLYKLQEDEEG